MPARSICACFVAVFCFFGSSPKVMSRMVVVDFESLPVPPAGFFNGDTSGDAAFRANFTIDGTEPRFGQTAFLQRWDVNGVEFSNDFIPAFDSWSGASWSNVQNSVTPGFMNQYASFPGGGSDGVGGVDSGTYAVLFSNGFINLPENSILQSVDLSNTTYSYLTMRDGDGFTDPFGGDDGNALDFLTVTLTGYDALNGSGNATGSLDIDLADYRFSDNSLDFIQTDWQNFDLSMLGNARSLRYEFSTSQPAGVPTYVALDNLRFSIVPEPSGLLMLCVLGSVTIASSRRRNQ